MEDDGDCKLMSSPEAARALTAWSFCVVAELVAYSAFRRKFFSDPRGRPGAQTSGRKKRATRNYYLRPAQKTAGISYPNTSLSITKLLLTDNFAR